MTMSSVLVWSFLFAPLTDEDLMRRPEVIQMRMAFLKPGMKEAEVKATLGIGQRQPACRFALNRYHSSSMEFNYWETYKLGSQQTLELVVHSDDKVLVSAKLWHEGGKPWDWQFLAIFPPKPPDENQGMKWLPAMP